MLGCDPREATREWRARIGVVLQTCAVQPELTVGELLCLYGGYYPEPLSVGETLGLVGLTEQRDQRAGALSGGQQRRLDVGLALVGNPELLFLDEPTTGFDPSARHHTWEVIEGLRELGKTVFLTTHYMDEAQALADRVAVIADGRIVAEGTPESLGGRDRAPTHDQLRAARRHRAGAGRRDREAPPRTARDRGSSCTRASRRGRWRSSRAGPPRARSSWPSWKSGARRWRRSTSS